MTVMKMHQKILLPKPIIKAQFLAEVQFGMPSKKCANYGICRVVPLGTETRENLGTVCEKRKCLGIITIFNQKHIEMDFLKKDISVALYRKYFEKGTFLVQEDFLYEEPLYKISISKGDYPIIENNSLIKVIFYPSLV